MPTKYLVEIGRVALVEYGANAGKLVTIVDVIDQNRALVDGTPAGVPRQAIQFKRLRLTKFRLPIAHSSSSRVVQKAYAELEVDKKFAETTLAKRLQQRAVKTNLTDFDRFKLYKTKQQYNRIVNKKLALLKFKSKAALKVKQNASAKKKQQKPVKK